MLDRLFLRKLNKQGKIMYFVLQLVFDAIYLFVLFGVLDYELGSSGSSTRDDTYFTMIAGILVFAIVSGIICLQFWRLEEAPPTQENKAESNISQE
ncbi:hypothetical protein AAG747_28145 [Rapidithrix thailandica]|uniref:Uncharacterized protein n=1 Tax=Rapidithrix thailandica TaxID=413964 RepID=A0AAW9SGU2_9BACT